MNSSIADIFKNSKKDIMLFGSGRSGTTWLAELISACGLELVFEPMNGTTVPEAMPLAFKPNYLVRGDSFDQKPLFTDLIKGKVRNSWSIRANDGAKRKIIKEISANLMIEWILENYDVYPIFMIRNPLAVIASAIELKWEIEQEWIDLLFSDDRIYYGYLFDFKDLYRANLSILEKLTLNWCIQNYIPKQQGIFEAVNFIRFEDLSSNTEEVLADLFPKLNLKLTDKVRAQYRQQSFMAGSEDKKNYDPLTSWKAKISSEDANYIRDTVIRFGLGDFLPVNQ